MSLKWATDKEPAFTMEASFRWACVKINPLPHLVRGHQRFLTIKVSSRAASCHSEGYTLPVYSIGLGNRQEKAFTRKSHL